MRYIYDERTQIAQGREQIYAIREDTGERILIDSYDERVYGQPVFWKMGKQALSFFLELNSAQSSAIFVYLISNMSTKDNIVNATFEEISKGANVAYKTVSRTMEQFRDCDFIRLIRRGKWMVNPSMFYRGKPWVHGKLRAKYYAIDKENNS